MSVLVMKEIRDPSVLRPDDYAAFADRSGRLELRLQGVDPFAVHDALREAGFRSVHTWVDGPGADLTGPVELRVTAVRRS